MRDIVLLHGAWQGGWTFDALKGPLEQSGWRVHVPELPGNGCDPTDTTPIREVTLELYVRHVTALLGTLPGRAVLVGHSGAGTVVSQVAEERPDLIEAAVYLVGMMLPNGWTYADTIDEYERRNPADHVLGVAPHLQPTKDGFCTTVPPEVAVRLFFNDLPRHDALELTTRLTPHPNGVLQMRPTLTDERFGSVRRIYIEATLDMSTPLGVQRLYQELTPGADRITLDSGHLPQVAQPGPLCDSLNRMFGVVMQ